MLGFSVSGVTIRYDIPEIALTAVADIVVVWTGLFVIELGKRKLPVGRMSRCRSPSLLTRRL